MSLKRRMALLKAINADVAEIERNAPLLEARLKDLKDVDMEALTESEQIRNMLDLAKLIGDIHGNRERARVLLSLSKFNPGGQP